METTRALAPRHGFGRLARDSAIYASGAMVGKAVGLLLLPVVTRVLGPSEFGALDVLSTLQSAVTSVLLLGLDVGATRLYADVDADGRRGVFGTWISLATSLAVPTGLTLVLFRSTFSVWLFQTDRYATAVALIGLAIVGATLQMVALNALRNHRRPLAFAVINAGTLVLNGSLVVVLLIGRATVTAVVLAMALSMSAGGIAGLWAVRRDVEIRPDRAIGRRMLQLGLPLLPAVAATWVAEFANRAILLRGAGATEVGYFSVAVRFSSVAVLMVLGFQAAWQPEAFSAGQDDTGLRRVADDGRRILVAVTAMVGALAVVSPEVLRVVSGPAFAPAVPALGLSLVFALGYAAFQVVTMPSAISRRMRDLGLAAGVAAGTGVLLNLWWAPRSGAGGTAAAVAVGQFVGVGVAMALARSQARVPFAWDRLVPVGVAGVVAVCVCTLPSGGTSPTVRLGVGLALAAVLVAEGSIREVAAPMRARLPGRG